MWTCAPEWDGDTVFIIGGGPSVENQNLERLRGRKVIVINSSIHRFPWADMLFFGDGRWWREADNQAAVDRYGGIVVTCSTTVKHPKVNVMNKQRPPGLASERNAVMVKRTSLTGAINLAVHRGAHAIVLLGADGKKSADGKTHHHRPHRWPQRLGCWDDQKKDLVTIVEPLKRRGIKVINASPGSAWADLWPVMSLDDAIAAADKDDVDFSAAEIFLQQARGAHERGDRVGFLAARKLAIVALGISDPTPPPRR